MRRRLASENQKIMDRARKARKERIFGDKSSHGRRGYSSGEADNQVGDKEGNDGKVKAKIVNKIFKGIHYQFTAMVGNNEVLIQSTVDHPVGQDISLTIEPDFIQIMKREYTANIYEDAYINKNNEVVFAGASWACDVTQLVEGATLDEKGYFITPNCKKYDLDINISIEEIHKKTNGNPLLINYLMREYMNKGNIPANDFIRIYYDEKFTDDVLKEIYPHMTSVK